MQTCFGNNQSSPYGLFLFQKKSGDSQAVFFPREREWTDRLKLDPGEVLAFVGVTPPQADYFSFIPYVFSRKERVGFLRWQEAQVFASAAQPLNQLTILDRCPENRDPFSRSILLLISKDFSAIEHLKSQAIQAGISECDILTQWLGIGEEESDDFLTLFRVSGIKESWASALYTAVNPNRVFRMHGPAPEVPAPVDQEIKAKSISSESYLNRQLEAIAQGLKEKLSGKYEISRFTPKILNPLECLANMTECLGDNPDAAYGRSPFFWANSLKRRNEDFFVVGVNHVATGQATYVNLNLYNARKLESLGSIDVRQLKGSTDSDLFYILRLSADCSGKPYCLTVPSKTRLGVVATRAYLNPETHTGPEWKNILPALMLKPRW